MRLDVFLEVVELISAISQGFAHNTSRSLANVELDLNSTESAVRGRALSQFPNHEGIECRIYDASILSSNNPFQIDLTDSASIESTSQLAAHGFEPNNVIHRKYSVTLEPRKRSLRGKIDADGLTENLSALYFDNENGVGSLVQSTIPGKSDAYRGYVWHRGLKLDQATHSMIPTLLYSKIGTYEEGGESFVTVTTVDYEEYIKDKGIRDEHLDNHGRSLKTQPSNRNPLESAAAAIVDRMKLDKRRHLDADLFIKDDKVVDYEFVVYEKSVAASIGGARNINADHAAFQAVFMGIMKRQIGKDIYDLRVAGSQVIENKGYYTSIPGALYFARSENFPTPPDNAATRVYILPADNSGIGGAAPIGRGIITAYVAIPDLLSKVHEKAHTLGAEHNDANAPERVEGWANADARAYLDPISGYGTAVSYISPTLSFSQDGGFYKGIVLGDARHNNLGYMVFMLFSYAGRPGYTLAPVMPHRQSTHTPTSSNTISKPVALPSAGQVSFTFNPPEVLDAEGRIITAGESIDFITIGNRKISFIGPRTVVTDQGAFDEAIGADYIITDLQNNGAVVPSNYYARYGILRPMYMQMATRTPIKFIVTDSSNAIDLAWVDQSGKAQIFLRMYKTLKSDPTNVLIGSDVQIKANTGNIRFNGVATTPTVPTKEPTPQPVATPSPAEPKYPTRRPSTRPTSEPTDKPTAAVTSSPSGRATLGPTPEPTIGPTRRPSARTSAPTPKATKEPTPKATKEPTLPPVPDPTLEPTPEPTSVPTHRASAAPTARRTSQPTVPTTRYSRRPTKPYTQAPSRAATNAPSATSSPTANVTSSATGDKSDSALIAGAISGAAAFAAIMAAVAYKRKKARTKNSKKPPTTLAVTALSSMQHMSEVAENPKFVPPRLRGEHATAPIKPTQSVPAPRNAQAKTPIAEPHLPPAIKQDLQAVVNSPQNMYAAIKAASEDTRLMIFIAVGMKIVLKSAKPEDRNELVRMLKERNEFPDGAIKAITNMVNDFNEKEGGASKPHGGIKHNQ